MQTIWKYISTTRFKAGSRQIIGSKLAIRVMCRLCRQLTTTKKDKKMKHNKYFPIRVGDQIIWLRNFSNHLGEYATILGLTPAQVSALVADCLWLIYLMESWLPTVRTWSQGCTGTVTNAQTGSGSASPVVLPVFTAPPLPDPITAQPPGSLSRIFAAATDINNNPKCTDDIAHILGIVGAVAVDPDLSAVQPPLSANVSGDHVGLKSGWGGYTEYLDNIEYQKDWGDGKGFVTLAITSETWFTDTAPQPDKPAVWIYQCIYRVGTQQVGLFSNPVSVAVGG
jgi:hypothetical protein